MSDLYAALDKAITDYAADDDGESVIVTKWVVAAEVASASSPDVALTTFRSNGVPIWDMAGMAGFVEARCKAMYAEAALEDDEDD